MREGSGEHDPCESSQSTAAGGSPSAQPLLCTRHPALDTAPQHLQQGQGQQPAGAATTLVQQAQLLQLEGDLLLQLLVPAAVLGASGAAAGVAPAAAAAPAPAPTAEEAALLPALTHLLAPLVPPAAAGPAAPALAEEARGIVARIYADSIAGEGAGFLQGVPERPQIAAETRDVCGLLLGTTARIPPDSDTLRYDPAKEACRDGEAALLAACARLSSNSPLGATVWPLEWPWHVAACVVRDPNAAGCVQFIYMGTWGCASLAAQAANTAALALHGGNTDAAQGWLLQHNPLVFEEVASLYRLP